MEHDDLEFDDPGLKGAIQRAWGGEHVPQRLRARVGRLIATAGSVDDVPAPVSTWDRWLGRVYGLAAAAIILFSVGLLVLYYQGAFDRTLSRGIATGAQPNNLPSKTEMPPTLAQSMVATHNSCGKLHDHRLVTHLAANTYPALSLKLTADLGFPVIARGIGADWKFKGAGECTVDTLRGAHLLFARGEEMVSVFSLPSSCMLGVAPGAQFDGTVQGHAVSGFSRGGAVYGIISSSPNASSTSATVTSIRDSLFGQFDPATCGEVDPTDLDFDY
ncbi:MAG: hypothetical protein M3478_07185 [Planctomycetota bacterium]|nr:hypothetical protein [Planctomycetota bacterium]